MLSTMTAFGNHIYCCELNLMDGGTTAGTTAVAGGDGIVTNDGGDGRPLSIRLTPCLFNKQNSH